MFVVMVLKENGERKACGPYLNANAVEGWAGEVWIGDSNVVTVGFENFKDALLFKREVNGMEGV